MPPTKSRRARETVIPIAVSGPAADLNDRDDLDAFLDDFGEGIDGFRFELSRKSAQGRFRYVADLTFPFTRAQVQAEYGPGDYRVSVKDAQHRYVKSTILEIDGPRGQQKPGENPGAIQGESQAPELKGGSPIFMLLMEQMRQSHAAALAQAANSNQLMIAMLSQRGGQSMDPIKLAELLSKRTPAEDLVQLADLSARLGGGGAAPASSGEGGIIGDLIRAVPTLAAMAEKFKVPVQPTPAQNPRAGQAPPPPTAPGTFPRLAGGPASGTSSPDAAQIAQNHQGNGATSPARPDPVPAVASVPPGEGSPQTAGEKPPLSESNPAMARAIAESKAIPALLKALPAGFDLDGALKALSALMLTIPRNPAAMPLLYAARIVEAFGNEPTLAMLEATDDDELAAEFLVMFPQLKDHREFLEDIEAQLRDQFQPIDEGQQPEAPKDRAA